MATEWKNQRKPPVGAGELYTLRMPKDLKAKAQKLADANDSTIAAIVRHSLEKFIEEQTAAKGSLFG